ncbi:MAG: hypothetical protein WC050_04190, partial [Candidatus Paceibacterota bacterium]
DERSLVKIVRMPQGEFLSEWTYEDLKREPYGVVSKRPMVYMTDDHEEIEKSMWCYERGMVPLAGEIDPDIAAFTAERYQIDQLITDTTACGKLTSYLSSRAERLLAISIIDTSFPLSSLVSLAPFAKQVRLVLALPETGVIAEAPLSTAPVFVVETDCTVADGKTLTLTKKTQLVTPITEYDTGIPISALTRRSDGTVESFTLSEE